MIRIIAEIINNKKSQNIEPSHALLIEVIRCASLEGISEENVRKQLNALWIAKKIKIGKTLNNTYIEII